MPVTTTVSVCTASGTNISPFPACRTARVESCTSTERDDSETSKRASSRSTQVRQTKTREDVSLSTPPCAHPLGGRVISHNYGNPDGSGQRSWVDDSFGREGHLRHARVRLSDTRCVNSGHNSRELTRRACLRQRLEPTHDTPERAIRWKAHSSSLAGSALTMMCASLRSAPAHTNLSA